ncbi:MAG: tripartite tricarboxylate transporter permease [Bacteroidota bacterium]
MFLELILAILLGLMFGTITGLTPGIHLNLISVMLLSASPILLQYTNPLALAVFIITMSVTHTFLDSIPSILLGAPESDTALGVLPGHRYLLKGQGLMAVNKRNC